MKADELKPFYYKTFRIEELENYFKQPSSTIRVQLSRLCKNKKIIRLKKNRYTFPDFHPDAMIMAQEIVQPSYHSLEAVLSLYGIIPEGVTAYTLITSQKTQQYTNEFGTFSYRHLPPRLFFGTKLRKDGVYIASPEKAILDYLYLNSSKFTSNIYAWRAERFDELTTLNFKRMKTWAEKYGMKKLVSLVKSLEDYSLSKEYQAHL